MDTEHFDLSAFLPYRLAVLSERVSKRLSLIYSETYGLTVAEWRVLVHLSHDGAVSVREIHERVNLEKPRVSRAVSRLEAAGMVAKVPSEADHRLVEISLTEAGRKVLRGIVPDALAYEKSLMASLTQDEITQFLATAEKLHRALDADPRAARRPAAKASSS